MENKKKRIAISKLKEAVISCFDYRKRGSEKEMIAGVFINRLNAGMKLQSDPTVIYALGSNFDGDIKKEIFSLTIHNTYRYKGLPPGQFRL